jgi:hypothetical protein
MTTVIVRDPVTGQLGTALGGFTFSSLKDVADDGYVAAKSEIVRCDAGNGAFFINAPAGAQDGDMFGVVYETPSGGNYNRLSVISSGFADFFGGVLAGGLLTLQGHAFIIFKYNDIVGLNRWQPLHLGGISDRKNFAEATFDTGSTSAVPLVVYTYDPIGEEEVRWKVYATARAAGGATAIFNIDAVFTSIGGVTVERFIHYVVDDREAPLVTPTKVDVDFNVTGTQIELEIIGQAATIHAWTIDLYIQCNPAAS